MKSYVPMVFLFVFSLFGFSQQTTLIDVKRGEVDIKIDPNEKSVTGTVIYTFDVLQAVDSMFVDAKNMQITAVFLNDQPVDYSYDNQKIIVNYNFNKKGLNTLKINYLSKPKKALYFISSETGKHEQVWTQGQGKYTSNWLPSFDDMNEKIEFDLTISAPKQYKVIANGKLKNKEVGTHFIRWKFDMKHPMSSYLVALVMGVYDVKENTSASGTALQLYFNPADSSLFEPTYRYTKQIFDFLEEEIEVPYPWQQYKQVPVKDFLYAGMENTSLTIFSNSYMVDSIGYIDKNYVSVNAHELAHQWFGDMVTEVNGTHHWLQEGFATYYALLAERKLFGEEHFYGELYKSAKALEALSKNNGESLLDPKASSLTFYQRGAWALFALRKKIGNHAFKETVKRYLTKFAFKNANTYDFFNIAKDQSKIPLDNFIEKWVVNKQFPIEEAQSLLRENSLTKELLKLDAMNTDEIIDFAQTFNKIYADSSSLHLVEEIMKRAVSFPDSIKTSIYKKVLTSELLKNRQMGALYITDISKPLQTDFENLLTDKSYITIENALIKLWLNFQENRPKYLNATKGIIGFKDKNVQTLWLALALITPNYEENKKKEYYQQLISYTAPTQHFEVRQRAFQYLAELNAFNELALKNLIQACQHPAWQFSNFSKQLLETLIVKPDYKTMLQQIKPHLNKNDQFFLNERLDD